MVLRIHLSLFCKGVKLSKKSIDYNNVEIIIHKTPGVFSISVLFWKGIMPFFRSNHSYSECEHLNEGRIGRRDVENIFQMKGNSGLEHENDFGFILLLTVIRFFGFYYSHFYQNWVIWKMGNWGEKKLEFIFYSNAHGSLHVV